MKIAEYIEKERKAKNSQKILVELSFDFGMII